MESTSSLPVRREVFLDARGDGRALRVTWHPEPSVVVLSLWRGRTCAGTFRLPVEDAPALVDVLRAGLADAYGGARTSLRDGLAGLDPFDATETFDALGGQDVG
jgi:hypothetical protein